MLRTPRRVPPNLHVQASATASASAQASGQISVTNPFADQSGEVVVEGAGASDVEVSHGSDGSRATSHTSEGDLVGVAVDGSGAVEGARAGTVEGAGAGNIEGAGHIESGGVGGTDSPGDVDDVGDASVQANASVDVVLRGEPGAPAERVGRASGVRAIETSRRDPTGRARLGMLTSHGLAVDGYRVRLGDLGPLAVGAAIDTDARIATDASIEAHAELEHAQLPAAGGQTNLVVRVRGGRAHATAHARIRVHLVVDRSSSMQSTWGEVLAAARTVVSQLRPDDEIHVVAYGSEAEEILPPIRVGDGRRATRALGEISVGGGTNIEAGLEVAYRAAAERPLRGNDRALVILLSDGVPNGGAFTAQELAPMATRARTQNACTTTVVGLGNQFDPAVLRAVATAGRGEYHVARTAGELGPMLRAELRAQMRVAVRDVRVNVDLPAGVELVHSDESSGVERVRGGVSLALPQLREAEERRIVLRVQVNGTPSSVARVRLQYRPPVGQPMHASKDLSVRFGARAELNGEATELALADVDLGRAVDTAATHVLNGRTSQAQEVLDAHVQRTESRGGFSANIRLRHRTTAVGRFARALHALVGGASHTERRELSIAMGGLAARLMR